MPPHRSASDGTGTRARAASVVTRSPVRDQSSRQRLELAQAHGFERCVRLVPREPRNVSVERHLAFGLRGDLLDRRVERQPLRANDGGRERRPAASAHAADMEAAQLDPQLLAGQRRGGAPPPVRGHQHPVALQEVERRELLTARGDPKVRRARSGLTGPLLGAQCRRQVIVCPQHRLRSVELAQLHGIVVDDRRLSSRRPWPTRA